jgi:membrane protein insertase Oxa1/YidC/SpoIIIJ
VRLGKMVEMNPMMRYLDILLQNNFCLRFYQAKQESGLLNGLAQLDLD